MKVVNKALFVPLVAALAAGYAQAGEMQYAVRVGGTMLEVDRDRMLDGHGSSTNGMAAGLSIGYLTEQGLLVEAALIGSFNVDTANLSGSVHKSLGVGWQFGRDDWRVTPKVGFLHSYLDSAEGRNLIEDGRPSERFTDTVPFLEASFDRRLGGSFGVGLFVRHIFEDFGNSQTWGLTLSFHH